MCPFTEGLYPYFTNAFFTNTTPMSAGIESNPQVDTMVTIKLNNKNVKKQLLDYLTFILNSKFVITHVDSFYKLGLPINVNIIGCVFDTKFNDLFPAVTEWTYTID